MYFGFRTYFRLLYLSFFRWREAGAPPVGRRLLFLMAFMLFFPVQYTLNMICLALDNLFFPGFRRVRLERPVFILGPPRSGTTVIQRILAADRERFFSFRTWEIAFPSIIQKRFISRLGALDRKLGGRALAAIERRMARASADFDRLHRIGLFLPEEDDKLLMHTLSCLDLIWFFPFAELGRLGQFDTALDRRSRERIMRFYEGCLKRQAYVSGRGRCLLSKSPMLSPKVRNLREVFPDARFICAVRTPLDVVPSMLSMAREMWRTCMRYEPAPALVEGLYEILKTYYRHPLAEMKSMPDDVCMTVNYDELKREPFETISAVYSRLGIGMSEDFRQVLKAQAESVRSYSSGHDYSCRDGDVDPRQIANDFEDIFEEFGFDLGTAGYGNTDRPAEPMPQQL